MLHETNEQKLLSEYYWTLLECDRVSLCLFSQKIELQSEKAKFGEHHENDFLEERKKLKEKASIVAQCLERKEGKVRNHAKTHQSLICVEDVGAMMTDLHQRPYKALKKNKNKTTSELDKKLPSNVIQELNTVLQKNRGLHDETSIWLPESEVWNIHIDVCMCIFHAKIVFFWCHLYRAKEIICLYAAVDVVYAYASCYNLRLNWGTDYEELLKFGNSPVQCNDTWVLSITFYCKFLWYNNPKHYQSFCSVYILYHLVSTREIFLEEVKIYSEICTVGLQYSCLTL